MDLDGIIFWEDKYDREEDLYNKGAEEQVRVKFKENRYVVKEGLEEIIKWEFQRRITGRQKSKTLQKRGVLTS